MAEKTPIVDAEAVEEKQPSLREIIDDKGDLGRSFNKWMEGQKKSELVAKLLTGKLKGEDLTTLAEEREEFLKQQTESKQMREELLADERIQEFVNQSPDLKKISQLVGMDGVKEALESVFQEMAVNPDGAHETVYDDFKTWKKTKNDLTTVTGFFEKFVSDAHLTKSETEALASVPDLESRREMIEKLWEGKGLQTIERKQFLWLEWEKKSWTAEQLAMMDQIAVEFSASLKDDGSKTKFQIYEKAIAKVNERLKKNQADLVALLRDCAYEESGAKEIGRLLASEKKPADKTMNLDDLKKEIKKEKDPEKYANDFFEYADGYFADFMADSGMAVGTLDEKNDAVDAFYAGFKREKMGAVNKKGGIWAAVYKAMIEPFMDEVIAELKANDRMTINKNRDDNYILTKKNKK